MQLATVAPVDDRPLVIALCPDLMMRSRIESGLDIAGYRLRVAGGPTRLAEALAEETPACILIDLEAGDDAIAVIEGLRGDPATAGIPLAAFAGHTNVDLLERAKAAAADDDPAALAAKRAETRLAVAVGTR